MTNGGLHWLDIVDKFVNGYGLIVVGLVECIVIGWIIGPQKIRDHVNGLSEIKVGKWFDFCVKYLTPAALIFILVFNLIIDIKEPYGGYPQWALNVGWAMVILLPIVAFIFSKFKTAKEADEFVEEQS